MQSTTNFASAWQSDSIMSSRITAPNEESGDDEYMTPSIPAVSTPTASSHAEVPALELSPTTTATFDPNKTRYKRSGSNRLNKFVRRLHEMLKSEKDSGIVEWRKGLLVLHSTDSFTQKILPKYFNTKNFKTFRRQLNYYGFVHVRSFSTTGSATTALWVNQHLANMGSSDVSSVLSLRRVEPCEAAKTAEGRRLRKEEATHTVADIGVSTRAIQAEQIRQMAVKAAESSSDDDEDHEVISFSHAPPIPSIVHCRQTTEATTFTLPAPPTKAVSYVSSDMDVADEEINTEVSSAYPTTDDAANLLLLFSKSAHSSD